MPPARKDPPQADDSSLPSTSRAFSPSLAPPPKRARTSTGGAPSSTASRRQSNGGRQARIEDFIDEKELQERLLVATMETADKMIEEEGQKENEKMEIDKEVIEEAAKIVWNALAEDWATDLIAFSRHAGRETIRDDDVKLLMRRNPDMLAEILAECEGEEEGEGTTSMGTTKRKSTGGGGGRSRKEAREEENMDIFVLPSDDVTTPRGGASSSMDSVVPETPQGIVPLAHSTPMIGRSISMIGRGDFSIPSPIGEIDEINHRWTREGKRPNRSILDDLSATIREGNGEMMEGREGGPGVLTQELDELDAHFASIMDTRHPREQEEEERRMRMEEGERDPNQLPGPSTTRQDYGRAESPELFGEDGEEKKEEEHDSFDDEEIFEEKDDRKGRNADKSHRMSESSVLREMLDEDEKEKDKTVIEKEKEDSFDDDSIQFVEVTKNKKKVASPLPMGDFPSTSAVNATVSGGAAASSTGVFPPTAAAPTAQATSDRSSQDSFYDDIIADPPQASSITLSSSTPILQQPTVAAAIQPARPDEYDSFDDDDDDFIAAPSRSKENITLRAIAGPSPTITVANRWSTVEVEEIVSPAAEKKKNENPRKVFAEDIFGINDLSAPSNPTPINRPSPTVPKRPSPAATIHQKSSPTVSTIPPSTVPPQPSVPQSMVKNTPVNKGVPSAGFSSFSFFGGDSQEEKTPTPKREDSDFVDTRSKQTTPTTKGGIPKWRGGARGRGGRGFPRKSDPNSKVNRMIREQSTPVRLSPRPPYTISEVVGSFEDDDFDASFFDD